MVRNRQNTQGKEGGARKSVEMEPFPSKRSPVICRNGCVSCSQPLAAEAGLRILRGGGNAADAAVAVAAALNVTEPCSTGIGGDCFCLYYDASTRKVSGINGSGRAPEGLSLEYLNSLGYNASNPFPRRHALSITVPGAAAAWADSVQTFGSGKVCYSVFFLVNEPISSDKARILILAE